MAKEGFPGLGLLGRRESGLGRARAWLELVAKYEAPVVMGVEWT